MGRTKIKKSDKEALLREAGYKCANPGCPQSLTEFHHIERWHVVRSHDRRHIITICPSCHDAVDRGALRITDETAYAWKAIPRSDMSRRGVLSIEPSISQRPMLILGRFAITSETSSNTLAFSVVAGYDLSFQIDDLQVMNLTATMKSAVGSNLFTMRGGNFLADGKAKLMQRAGMVRVTHPMSNSVLPEWVIHQIRQREVDFAAGAEVTLLEVQVIKPNVVSVQGIWVGRGWALVATSEAVYLCREGRPLTGVFAAQDGYLMPFDCVGRIDKPLFQLRLPGVENADGYLTFT